MAINCGDLRYNSDRRSERLAKLLGLATAMQTPHRFSEVMQHFAAPENCLAFMISIRWKDGFVTCPHCGSREVTYLAKARLWKCHTSHPKQKFSPKTGTVFEHSILGLNKLLAAIWMMVNSKEKLSSYQLASAIQISQKSAWRLMNYLHGVMQMASLPTKAPVE